MVVTVVMIVVVTMVVVVLMLVVVTLAAIILALLPLCGLLAATILALTLVLVLMLTAASLRALTCLGLGLNLNLCKGLNEVCIVGLGRVVGYGDGLGGDIHLNILNTLLVGDGVGNLLGATLAVDIGQELGGYGLLLGPL